MCLFCLCLLPFNPPISFSSSLHPFFLPFFLSHLKNIIRSHLRGFLLLPPMLQRFLAEEFLRKSLGKRSEGGMSGGSSGWLSRLKETGSLREREEGMGRKGRRRSSLHATRSVTLMQNSENSSVQRIARDQPLRSSRRNPKVCSIIIHSLAYFNSAFSSWNHY